MSFFSKLFGKPKDDPLKSAMQAIYRMIDDEDHQNSMLPDPIAQVIKGGLSCDVIPGATGPFGLDPSNPIPVNGAIGELAYLSRLETAQGERLLFHRIGAVDKLDVFEAVTYSGSAWYVFFVDMYHPRRSRRAPEGFVIASEPRQFSGFHNFCEDFPYDFVKAKQASADLLRLGYIPLSHVTDQIDRRAFTRPLSHKAKLDIVKSQLSSRLVHSTERSDATPKPILPDANSLSKERPSFDHVMFDLHNKFLRWVGFVYSDDVTTKVMQRQVNYEAARVYVFALFVLRDLIADSNYLRSAEFFKLKADTATKLTAQRVKMGEEMFAPLKIPGMNVGVDAQQIRAQIDKDLGDAVAGAKACAERLQNDGIFNDERLVQFFLAKAPHLSTEQKRKTVARELSAYTHQFALQ